MPVSEVPLKKGLKYMLVVIAAGIGAGASLSAEQFELLVDESVDSFLAGLRTNGYEIRPIEDNA